MEIFTFSNNGTIMHRIPELRYGDVLMGEGGGEKIKRGWGERWGDVQFYSSSFCNHPPPHPHQPLIYRITMDSFMIAGLAPFDDENRLF